jgi:Reverse transcriptase (RNA-dependent DNA polymerase)
LKQSPRCWNKALQEYLELNGFHQSTADPCVFVKFLESLVVIAVYVDALILLTQTADDMRHIKRLLETQFRMKDMGDLHYYLGIGVEYDNEKHLLW